MLNIISLFSTSLHSTNYFSKLRLYKVFYIFKKKALTKKQLHYIKFMPESDQMYIGWHAYNWLFNAYLAKNHNTSQ